MYIVPVGKPPPLRTASAEAVTTVIIRLFWSSMRHTGSTLGRLRAIAAPPVRAVQVSIPSERGANALTHWRQLTF